MPLHYLLAAAADHYCFHQPALHLLQLYSGWLRMRPGLAADADADAADALLKLLLQVMEVEVVLQVGSTCVTQGVGRLGTGGSGVMTSTGPHTPGCTTPHHTHSGKQPAVWDTMIAYTSCAWLYL